MDAREGARGGDCACEGRDDMTGDAALGRLIRMNRKIQRR
jgi:hypothetical protein